MAVAPPGEPLAFVFDVGLVMVGVGDFAEGGGKVGPRSVEQTEIVREVHQAAPVFDVASAASPPAVGGTVAASGAGPPTVGAGDEMPSASATLVNRTAATLKIGCFETGPNSYV